MAFLKSMEFFDFFGIPVYLNFGKKKRRKSLIGFFFSISIIVLLIYQFSQSDLFVLEKPLVVRQTVETTNFPAIFFDKDHLITVQVSNRESKRIIDLSIFNITFRIFHVKTDENGVSSTLMDRFLTLHPCKIEDVSFSPTLFTTLSMNNSLCLDQKEFKLEGSFNEGDVYYAVATLKTCQNGTSIICKSKKEITEFFAMNLIFFSAQYHNVIADVNDYLSPIKLKINMQYQMVDPQISKRFNIYLKKYELTTDDGWIFSKTSTKTDFGHESLNFDFSMRTANDPILFQILFYSSNKVEKISRRYEKLPETLGQMMGMANLVIYVCLILISQRINIKTMTKILNKLYFFKLKKKRRKTLNKTIKTKNQKKSNTVNLKLDKTEQSLTNIKKALHILPNSLSAQIPNEKVDNNQVIASEHIQPEKISISNINLSFEPKNEQENIKDKKPEKLQINMKEDSFILEHYSINSDDKKKENVICEETKKEKKITISENFRNLCKCCFRKEKSHIEKKNKLSIGYFQYICHIIGRNFGLENKCISQAEKIFNKEIDLIKILAKLHDVERIKLILFNQDQLILFNSLAKPLINLSSGSENLKEFKSPNLRVSKIIESYKNKKNVNAFEEAYKKTVQQMKDVDDINSRLIDLLDKKKINI